eukprot:CAMPEP_0172491876 /NCGR_PEP_ID=MMETSP1066-20121228/22789_1 /TAXON_ID=671091 /ORGANISM="Coscinodiscus wailesii, Strain CCMP2513" /LENGTH=161 /DNA_ID=CAMNT_0013261151 /DNA_START=662 /DNA_END=1145 /DNA_ORIENTATION=+
MSRGRTDEHYFQKGVDSFGVYGKGETKVTKSVNRVPLIKHGIEVVNLMHIEALEDGTGYIIVSRAVWETEAGKPPKGSTGVTRSEIMLGANMLREFYCEGEECWCEFTTVTHVSVPGVPLMFGKKVGLDSARNFVRDNKVYGIEGEGSAMVMAEPRFLLQG